jgi:hypothetical protein
MPRPRTDIKVPHPSGTEFENLDRLAGILRRTKPAKKKTKAKRKKSKPKA